MSRYFFILLLFSYLFSGCSKIKKVEEIESPIAIKDTSTNKQSDSSILLVTRPEPARDTIIIHKERFIHNSKNIDCSFTREYPRLEYKKDTVVQEKINKVILDSFNITKFRKTPKSKLCVSEENITDYKPFIYQKKILSISLKTNFFGEGAGHGYNNTTVLNLNLETGNKISPESIFIGEQLPELKQKILDLAKPQIDSLLGEYPLEVIENHINDLIYTIEGQGITFYAVTGNGQIQELQLFMPFVELKKYLKKNSYFDNL